ncbi:hypothetical protein C2222_03085 [Salmonella enterica subsp. enterica serovar Typhimurium]|nr:hypothetical protein [Salmonella enterica subsp. enterica serovar Typhimurium]EAY3282036.1 hypothetical protein [Salmonella enterica subsp. enterica serovar Typhimurium]EHG7412308.1 hypothetical protein [Salmonella enterica subsp. enterica serovar Agona]
MSASPVVKTGEEAKYHLIQKNISKVGLGETINLAAGAVQKTGDEMNGKLTLPQTSSFGVNTNNTLGGSSIAIGD